MALLDELEKLNFLRHFTPAYQRQIASLARLEEFPAETEILVVGEHG